MISLGTVLTAIVVGTILLSIWIIRRLDPSSRRWGDLLRERFVMGVPWGTFVSIGFVLCVYLFVQDGISQFHNPVTTPFRSWSYFYPVGIATAGFSHASSGHLIGNLVGTLVAAPIAEYAWGHYPARQGTSTFSSLRTNPWVRALVIFPAAVIVVGLLTSVFALGPVIGFSGVVFAFAGFAIVRYPLTTVLATVVAQGVVSRTYQAIQRPIHTVQPSPSPPSPPSWAEIAIQGHALGFFIGLLLAVVIFHRRSYRPDPLRLWVALLFYGFSKSLWAVYWFGADDTYILFQGPGIVVVTGLAVVITLALTGPERPLLSLSLQRRLSRVDAAVRGGIRRPVSMLQRLPVTAFGSTAPDDRSPRLERIASLGAVGSSSRLRTKTGSLPLSRPRVDRVRSISLRERTRFQDTLVGITKRQAAFLAVVAVVALVMGPAIPFNLLVVEDTSNPDGAVTIEDYTVKYSEGTDNRLVSGIDVPFLDTSVLDAEEGLESSGVIVSSSDRHIWQEAVSIQRLEFSGEATIDVGGPGWRERVYVERQGWTPVGNDTTYHVWLWADGEDRQLVHTAEPSQAELILGARNVTVVADDGDFFLEVSSKNETALAPMPEDDDVVEVNGLVFERNDDDLYAATDETLVRVASRETYD